MKDETNYERGYKDGKRDVLEKIRAEDAISRQAAQAKIKSICNEYGLSYEDGERKPATGGSAYALGHAFDDLPPVTPQQRWIPVSERLPKEGTYLVTLKGISGESIIDMMSFAKDLYKVDEFDFPNKHRCGWYGYDSEYGYWECITVIAWMPLPEPYKAESEGK